MDLKPEDDRLQPINAGELDLVLRWHRELFLECIGQRTYLFLDEAQNVAGWERWARPVPEAVAGACERLRGACCAVVRSFPVNLDPLVNLLRARVVNLVAVYVFGSGETGGTHRQSDIDLAVLAGSRLDALARADLAAELGARAGRDVDLVDLRSASTVMRFQVVSTGRRLLCLDRETVARVEMYALADYCRPTRSAARFSTM